MLEFNPHLRWSAKECLKSHYFDDVRIPQLEKKSKHKITLNLDDLSLEELHEKIHDESNEYKTNKTKK